MEFNYVIEVTMPNTGTVAYIVDREHVVPDPKMAATYPKNSAAARYLMEELPKEYKPRLVSNKILIGTYISTYKGKYRLSYFFDYAENKPLLQAITLPFLLPIAELIYLTRKIKNKYNQYVTNNR